MQKGGDALAVVLDERRGMGASRDRLGHRAALLVHPRLALGRPVGEAERRVAERVGERVPERPAVAESDDEIGDPGALEARAEDPCEERDRHQRERRECGQLDRESQGLLEGPEGVRHHEPREGDQGEEVDRPDHAPQRRRGGTEAPDETDEDEGHERRRGDPQSERGQARETGAIGDQERAFRATVASRDRCRVDERDRERTDRHDHEHGPHDPLVTRLETAGRVREDQVRKRDEGDTGEDVADREHERRLRELERAQGPEEPDGEHLRAGSVVGSLEGGDRSGDGEDQAGDGDDRDQDARLAEVRGRHQVDGAGVHHGPDEDRGREPAARHRRRKRTAAPVSSALAMKPRAPLERMRPL